MCVCLVLVCAALMPVITRHLQTRYALAEVAETEIWTPLGLIIRPSESIGRQEDTTHARVKRTERAKEPRHRSRNVFISSHLSGCELGHSGSPLLIL